MGGALPPPSQRPSAAAPRWRAPGPLTRIPDDNRIISRLPPARSSWTNKLITAKDHRSVQINVGHLDESGVFTGSFSTFAMCGQVRQKVSGGAGIAPSAQRSARRRPAGPPPRALPPDPGAHSRPPPPTLELQGDADSAMDNMWKAKATELGQR